MSFSQKAPRAVALGLRLSFYITENKLDNPGALSRAEPPLDRKLPAWISIGVPVPVIVETSQRRIPYYEESVCQAQYHGVGAAPIGHEAGV